MAEEIESVVPELGLVGVGEITPGGLVTMAMNPVEIARAMSPIMEGLSPGKLPVQFPTGWTGWQGGLHYIWNPIWVDELAALFPDVPIVLAKMGMSFGFEAARVTRHKISSPSAFFPHHESLSPFTASPRRASASSRNAEVSSCEKTPRTNK